MCVCVCVCGHPQRENFQRYGADPLWRQWIGIGSALKLVYSLIPDLCHLGSIVGISDAGIAIATALLIAASESRNNKQSTYSLQTHLCVIFFAVLCEDIFTLCFMQLNNNNLFEIVLFTAGSSKRHATRHRSVVGYRSHSPSVFQSGLAFRPGANTAGETPGAHQQGYILWTSNSFLLNLDIEPVVNTWTHT